MPNQRFRVPQFIDVEDKILGPITVRQFVIILGGFFAAAIGYALFDFTLFVIWALIWIGGACILAFVRVNGMPFHFFLLNIILTIKSPPIRVWNKNLTNSELRALAFKKPDEKAKAEIIPTKDPLKTSSLSELSLIADTGGAYKGETVIEQTFQMGSLPKKKGTNLSNKDNRMTPKNS